MSGKDQKIKCMRCQTVQPHSLRGTAYEEHFIEVDENEFEPGDPTPISLFQCFKCGLISLWIMESRISLKSKSGPKDKPVACIYRDIDLDPPYSFAKLAIDKNLALSLEQRWRDTQKCMSESAWLGAIILMGSILEGMLLSVINANKSTANKSKSAPKDRKSGKVKPVSNWTLANMIDVANSVGWINDDVKKYSSTLREFRNFVHPNAHSKKSKLINIDEDTCMISWHVLQAAINQLSSHIMSSKRQK